MQVRLTPAMRGLQRMREHPDMVEAMARTYRGHCNGQLRLRKQDGRKWVDLPEVEREMWRRRVFRAQLALAQESQHDPGPDDDGGGLPMLEAVA